MLISRALHVLVIASFLRLTWAGVAPVCETHADGAPRSTPASHALHSHAGGQHTDDDTHTSRQAPAPTGVPVCCALMAACGGPGIDAVDASFAAADAGRLRVTATPTSAPDSRIVAPEPPPPKP